MDQNYNSNQNEFLWALLANPANDAHLYNYNLQRLVNDFPQSGILQALFAHSSDEKNLKQASVYFNARSLYKLINAPASLTGVSAERIILQNNLNGSNSFTYQHHDTDNGAAENYFSDHSAVGNEIAEPVHAEDHQPVVVHEEAPLATDEHHTEEVVAEQHEEEVIPEHHSEETVAEHHEVTLPAADEHHGEEAVAEHHEEVIPEHHAEETISEHPTEETSPEHHTAELIAAPAIALAETEILHHFEEPAENVADDHHHTEEAEEIVQSHPIEETVENSVEDKHETPEHEPVNNLSVEDKVAEQHLAELSETTSEISNEAPVEEPVENKVDEEHTITPQVPELKHEEIDLVNNHLSEITPALEEKEPVNAEEHHQKVADQPKHFEGNIEDETFDEITGIENINIETEIVHNIAATDYFMFDNAFSEQKEPVQATATPETAEAKAASESKAIVPSANDTEQQDVSKYHDEKMPYSFMWWLDKTRKEHASVYQPYLPSETTASINNGKPAADALQQQYYENIFHITSFEELDKGTTTPSQDTEKHDPKRKEDVIIERFIQEEPQIKPQSSDKLDNENKAKKSSEDRDEIVTETLAAIYSDQMLYHKAIASYKKLMLKFPEKSRYFASKIEQLEKKTN